MLLDPFKEQFDLPAAFVKRADSHCQQGHLIAEEDERLAGFWVVEAHPEQMRGVILLRAEAIQRDYLVAEDANHAKGTFLANMSHEIRTLSTASSA